MTLLPANMAIETPLHGHHNPIHRNSTRFDGMTDIKTFDNPLTIQYGSEYKARLVGNDDGRNGNDKPGLTTSYMSKGYRKGRAIFCSTPQTNGKMVT